MKVVVLTNRGSLFGKKILNNLLSSYSTGYDAWVSSRREIAIEAVVINQPLKYYWRLFKYVQRRVGIVDALYFSVERLLARVEQLRDYSEMEIPVSYTRGINSKETLGILRDLIPDLLLLGQTGIVKRSLLEIPRIGTLNAHPGVLPYYRGVDCAKWAIYNDEFHRIGCSVHWVDSGVDTGNIIIKQAYDFQGNETTRRLEENLYNLCISMLTKVVSSIQEGNIIPGTPQSRDEGKQYFKMFRRLEVIVQSKLSEFLKEE